MATMLLLLLKYCRACNGATRRPEDRKKNVFNFMAAYSKAKKKLRCFLALFNFPSLFMEHLYIDNYHSKNVVP